MDTIVQVKFFGFFKIHLKHFALVWEVTDDMFWNQYEKENVFLTVIDYLTIIPRAEWALSQ